MLLAFIFRYYSRTNIFKSIYYTYKFGCCCIIGKVYTRQIGKIEFSDKNSVLLLGIDGTTPLKSQILNEGVIKINGFVNIYKGTKIIVAKHAELSIKNGTYINEYCKIFCKEKINIGAMCAIAFNVVLMDSDLHIITTDGIQLNKNTPINIGNHVWIGAYSIVNKGSNIKDNVIIGATSRVSGNIDSNYIYAGNPIRKIRQFQNWE